MKEYTVRLIEGNTLWYYKGELHRDEGPAIEYANGDKCYYINGTRVHPPAKQAKVEFIIFNGTRYQIW